MKSKLPRLSLPNISLSRIFSSVAWKIAIIAIGPIVGVALTVGLSQYAETASARSRQCLQPGPV